MQTPSTPDSTTEPTVLLVGGGSAGHVSPMLATADALRRQHPQLRVLCLGTPDGLEADLVPAAGYELLTIEKVPFPRRLNGAAARFPLRFTAQLRAVRRLLREHRVAVVAGFGGYVCPPAYLAAASARIPIVIHEANKRPGLANRLGARVAARVATAFDGSTLKGSERVGMPMRRAIAEFDRTALRPAAIAEFGLDPQRPTVLVTGGSLGAQRINETIRETAAEFAEAGAQVLHITGRGKGFALDAPHYHQVEYVRAMELAYAAADLAITRSGAGTVCEVTAVGLPAVFVPLPIGNGEQALNAEKVVADGGALLVRDDAFSPEWICRELIPLATSPDRLSAMAAASAAHGVRDADQKMARLTRAAAEGARR